MPLRRSAFSVPFSSPGRSVSGECHSPQPGSGERCVPDSGGSASQRSHSAADAEERSQIAHDIRRSEWRCGAPLQGVVLALFLIRSSAKTFSTSAQSKDDAHMKNVK
ncbi:hypothetical protein NDU88_011024 [Pleurodeles waltl]|uniref:Uncharacterized protein n=1 Tax=Pleurodeles waltl TaxID=8319 RepID=A0AAV7S2G8_PLEWA|nr:hypothetical protein NDU88_011024 [Pleurodeles waltl]